MLLRAAVAGQAGVITGGDEDPFILDLSEGPFLFLPRLLSFGCSRHKVQGKAVPVPQAGPFLERFQCN